MATIKIKLRTSQDKIRLTKPKIVLSGGIEPSGTIEINANGVYDVKYYEFANVNVPIPEGYLKPFGLIEIKSTNEIDVKEYEKAKIVDENLKAENIAENVEVLGIVGTFRGGIDTSDGTITADKVLKDEIGYAKEERIVGTIETYDYSNSEEVSPEIDKYLQGQLTELRNNRITNICNRAFYIYPTIKVVDCPNVEILQNYTFYNCELLHTVNLPKVHTIKDASFQDCRGLTNIDLPSIVILYQNVFNGCYVLEKVSLGDKISTIYSGVFSKCYSLKKVVITNTTSVAKLMHSNVFDYCYHLSGTVNTTYNPEGLKDGYIYVPDELVEDYKVATNWSTYADQIKPLSELEVE